MPQRYLYVRHRLRLLFCSAVLLPACGDAAPGSRPATGPAVASTSTRALPPDVSGHWFISRDGERLAVDIQAQHRGQPTTGTSQLESAAGASQTIDGFQVDGRGLVEFHVAEPDGTAWYRMRVADGVVMGRFARTTGAAPSWPGEFQGRLTGWRQETFDADIVPRVWDIALADGGRAVLRIDRPSAGSSAFIGTLKPYALQGQLAEQPAEQIDVQSWDGQNLAFARRAATPLETYQGTASGRMIGGQVQVDGAAAALTWDGTRTEVLTHGIGVRTLARSPSGRRPPGIGWGCW